MKVIIRKEFLIFILINLLLLPVINGKSERYEIKFHNKGYETNYPLQVVGYVWDFCTQGDLLFISMHDGTIRIYDNENPEEIKLLKTIMGPEKSYLAACDDLLITGAFYTSEIWTINVSNPLKPEILDRYESEEEDELLIYMLVYENYLFTQHRPKVKIYDLSNPRNLTKTTTYPGQKETRKLLFNEDLLFRYDSFWDGVVIFDAINILEPIYLSTIDIRLSEERVIEVVIRGNYLITFPVELKAKSYKIENPADPELVDLGDLQRQIDCVTHYGYIAYIADPPNIYLMSIVDPENIKTIGIIERTYGITKMETDGKYLFCKAGNSYGVIPVEDYIDYEIIESTLPESSTSQDSSINLGLSGKITGILAIMVIAVKIREFLSKKKHK